MIRYINGDKYMIKHSIIDKTILLYMTRISLELTLELTLISKHGFL